MPITISPQTITDLYAGLDRIGAQGDMQAVGYHRPAWSDAETAAMRHIATAAEAGGLQVRWDSVGNLTVETPGSFAAWVETGSHVDTVAGGGNFDGTAGVIAGLAALLAVRRHGLQLRYGLRLRVWRGEESAAFGVVSAGSRAAFGLLDAMALRSTGDGGTLEEAMRNQEGDPVAVYDGTPTIVADERDAIAAYVELHIEQGRVLEGERIDIGIVSGIRGSLRSWVDVEGAFDHSGATPMGREFRKDANLAIAHMQLRLDALAHEAIGNGIDLVQTIGVVNASRDRNGRLAAVYDNAVSKVSGFGYFSHEVRGVDGVDLQAYVAQAGRLIMDTATEFGVRATIEEFSAVDGIADLDAGIRGLLARACEAAGASFRELPSGAWHDAAVVHGVRRGDGTLIPVGMLFIPCRGGISHSPEEYASPEQIALGATVLLEAMLAV